MSDPVTFATLAPLPCWVAWQLELRDPEDKKPTKVPRNPRTGGKAMASNPATWAPRTAAEDRAAKLTKPFGLGGVGLEFCPLADDTHLSGIDLDACRDPDSGAIEPWAMEWIEALNSYTEVSPSGTGVKVFFRHAEVDRDTLRNALGIGAGGKPKHSSLWARRTEGDHPPAIELHLSNRYFAVTDQVLDGSPVELRVVPTDDLLRMIRVAGPAFVKTSGVELDDGDDTIDPAPTGGTTRRKRDILGNDQSRSVQAFRAGGKARREGADFDGMCEAIREAVPDWYEEKGVANGKRELHNIWDKVNPFAGDLILSSAAPLVSAAQFVGRLHTIDGVRTLHHQNAGFYEWKGSHYVERAPEEMRAGLYRFLDKATTYSGEELVAFNPSRNKVLNVLDALAAETQLDRAIRPPAWLNRDANLHLTQPPAAEIIALKNELLHLPTRSTAPHSPLFFNLNAVPFAYDPKPPVPTKWLAFLNSIWPGDADSIAVVQELFGLCLTPDTSHQKAVLIVGPKRSGKGTIARVLTELLGTANVCSPTLGSLSTNFGLSPLIGRRLAIISDARLSGKADQAVIAERLLAITGEDAQTIDRKFRDPWTGKLDVRFLILTNELPRLTDSSGALASRFIILKIVPSFFGREDHGLLGKLLPELPGILAWAIEGWERLNKRGYFVPPASSAAAMQELEDLGSPIGAFLRDRCTIEPGAAVPCGVLYAAWREWCQDHGRDHPGSTQTFGRDLAAAVAGMKVGQPRDPLTGAQVRTYEGVGLKRGDTRVEPLCATPDYFRDNPGSTPPPSHPQHHWHR